ncbi:MAG: RAMP superfamily CRISPR-associated protein [Jaaginema sp. PMC 1079.18]|nr:RAMP superfamily CRISPR-associated protein [Jaaginema sp. PMC 1080.18]MEC4853053.1 RAMP superfamily CRISPR-associated protein [Jaaginema sp. PMC 1079.18]MEC4866752.1 RAMP superfamily CRISPR-associated protein [Jaaginema sp. PMC 1078.18]
MSLERLNRHQRPIAKRIIVRGTLILDTPTCLGSGDADSPTDLAILRDSISDHALLTGSSIAGALRNYLREYERGYGKEEQKTDRATSLFGGTRRDDDGEQSPLIVNDAISSKIPTVELRDGVEIEGTTGTAKKGHKYDLELLAARTEFSLCFELLIEQKQDPREQLNYEDRLVKSLALALRGLELGEISMGMKKRRGFGRCHVDKWQVWEFNLSDESDRTAWLLFERECTKSPVITNKITDALGVVLNEGEDQRDRFTIDATFKLASPLLIRSGQAETGCAPDVVHLKSARIINEVKYFLASCLRQQMFSQAIAWLNLLPQEITVWTSENLELFLLAYFLLQPSRSKLPILSGTSLVGVLRHRAERIVNTLKKPTTIIDEIFGPDFSQDKTKQAKASRLIVHESVIENTAELVQTRIAIDRFTGGAYHGALFQEQPVFANDETELKLEIELRNPIEHEIGLLLLLLKDLWTEDLPVGGGSSVGRGRLKGKKATMTWKDSIWEIEKNGDNFLKITPEIEKGKLETYVSELANYLKENNNNEPSNS